jgi:hypothetical protein
VDYHNFFRIVNSLLDSLLQETRPRLLNEVESFLSSSNERLLVDSRLRATKPTLESTAQSLGLTSFIRQPTVVMAPDALRSSDQRRMTVQCPRDLVVEQFNEIIDGELIR